MKSQCSAKNFFVSKNNIILIKGKILMGGQNQFCRNEESEI